MKPYVIADSAAPMKTHTVQAVTVCVNFADILEHTLINNLAHFDYLVVVTSHKDRATQALCRKMSIQCVKTDDFYHEGANFNKARGINIGLAHLKPGGWRLHIDADIALPPTFRAMLRHHPLREDSIYGADRLNVYGFDAWQRVRGALHMQHNYHYMVSPFIDRDTDLGSRFVHNEWGYCPIGFFQLWHSSLPEIYYPVNQGSANHTDVTFAIQWPREKRALIPELFVYHLESARGQDQKNWDGRKTDKFGPEKKPAAEAKPPLIESGPAKGAPADGRPIVIERHRHHHFHCPPHHGPRPYMEH